jgi:pimeloyl-ACP methyl ester carboxylesterase
MPEISNKGVKISYEVAGQGRPLVLLHGWACDHAWWIETGFIDDLQRDHRVVNVDLRGHGDSDKPHEPSAYGGDVVVSDVLAVADAEGFDRFALWGFSYGGWVAWMTAYAAPERVAALISTGQWDPRPEIYDEAWQAFDDGWLEGLRRDGMQGLVDQFGQEERDAFLKEPPAWARAMFLRGDPQALLAIQSRELLGQGIPTLEGFPVPTLLIAGEFEDEDDDAAVIAGMLPHGEHLRLPGLGHADAQVAPELVLPAARAFLDRWFGEQGTTRA